MTATWYFEEKKPRKKDVPWTLTKDFRHRKQKDIDESLDEEFGGE